MKFLRCAFVVVFVGGTVISNPGYAQGGLQCTRITVSHGEQAPGSQSCPDSILTFPGPTFTETRIVGAECLQASGSGVIDLGPAAPGPQSLGGTGVCFNLMTCNPIFNATKLDDLHLQWTVQNVVPFEIPIAKIKVPGCALGTLVTDNFSCAPSFGSCSCATGAPAPCSNAICNPDGTWTCPTPPPPPPPPACSSVQPNSSCSCDAANDVWVCQCNGTPPACPNGNPPICQTDGAFTCNGSTLCLDMACPDGSEAQCGSDPNHPTCPGGAQPCDYSEKSNETCVCGPNATWSCQCSGAPPTCPDQSAATCSTGSWSCGSDSCDTATDPSCSSDTGGGGSGGSGGDPGCDGACDPSVDIGCDNPDPACSDQIASIERENLSLPPLRSGSGALPKHKCFLQSERKIKKLSCNPSS
jgi:hypothetical protein